MCKEKLGVVAFDMDGVLVKCKSSWEYLHESVGSAQIVQQYRYRDMFVRGQISYIEWMKRDLEAILQVKKGKIGKKEIEYIFSKVEIEDYAQEVVSFIKSLGILTAIVSAGIDVLAERVARELGIDIVYANKLLFDETGYLRPNGIGVVNPLKKDVILMDISRQHKVPLNKFMFVGDSEWDLTAFKVVKYPVFYVKS
ncbi:MAG TPA: HAD family hydrolase, partial [Acidilobales archaeon]|nr:HAD family hydrolase [Acidilobales archaeon]